MHYNSLQLSIQQHCFQFVLNCLKVNYFCNKYSLWKYVPCEILLWSCGHKRHEKTFDVFTGFKAANSFTHTENSSLYGLETILHTLWRYTHNMSQTWKT